MGMEEVPQAAALGLGLELLEDRRMEVRVAGRAHLLLVDGLGGIDVLVHERVDALHVLPAAVAGLEVHVALSRTNRRMPSSQRSGSVALCCM
jgi:hypothetical protein